MDLLETRLLLANITSTAVGGIWNAASTWVGMVVPGGSDNVTIIPGAHVEVANQNSCNSLLTQQGSYLTIDANTPTRASQLVVSASSGGGNITNVGGYFEIDGPFYPPGTGTINLTGTTNINATGSIQGGNVTTVGMMNVDGGGMYGGNLTNSGTLTVGTAGILLGMGATITNAPTGKFTVTGDAGFIPSTYPVEDGGTFINQGTFTKSGGTGINEFADYTDANSSNVNLSTFENVGGTVDIESGTFDVNSTAYLEGGTYDVSTGATLEFDGINTDPYYFTVNVSDTLTGSGGGTIAFDTGTLQPDLPGGTGAAATLNFPAGLVQVGNVQFSSYNTALIDNVGYLDFTGSTGTGPITLVNDGTVVDTATTDVSLTSFTNDASGIFDLQTDAGLGQSTGNIAHNLNNYGTFEKTVGTGTSVIGANLGNFGGTIDVEAGTISLQAGGNQTYISGPVNISPGSALDVNIAGSLAVSGTFAATGGGVVNFLTGTLNSPEQFDAADGLLPGTLDFTPGTFVDTGGILDSGNNPLTNAGTVDFIGDVRLNTITNTGTLLFDAGPDFLAGNIANEATGIIDFAADTALSIGATVTNDGTIIKSGGTGTLSFAANSGGLVNQGTIEAASGTIELSHSSQSIFSYDAQNNPDIAAGQTLKVDAGAAITLDVSHGTTAIDGTVILNGPGASFPELATVNEISGTGALEVLDGATLTTAGSLVNSGTLSVGGPFSINGDFTQTQDSTVATPPVLDFAVGAAPGPAAPALAVTGTTTLAGDLTADYTGGFGAAAGTAYTVATLPTAAVGAFADTSGVGPAFTVAVTPTTIVLNATGAGTADLAVTSVTAPATFAPGQPGTVTWLVTNVGASAASGTWVDSVYLSADGTINPADVLLGRVPYSAGLVAGASYTGTLTAQFPALVGSEKVVVVADSGEVLADTDRTNNIGVSGATGSAPPILTLGGSVTGTLAAGQELLYQLVIPAGGSDVRVTATLPSPQLTDLEISRDAIPTPGDADVTVPASYSSNLLAGTIPSPQPGTYYIRLYGESGAGAGTSFTLSAAATSYATFGVSPSTVGAGKNPLTISGTGFAAGSTVQVVSTGGAVVASAGPVTARDAETLLADVDLTGVAAGTYSLVVTTGANTATLTNALVVQAATTTIQPVQFDMSAPLLIRFNHVYDLFVTYTNPNDVAVPAPLFEISAPNLAFRLTAGTGGSTIGADAGFSDGFIDLLGINQTGEAGTLPANYTGVYDIQFQAILNLAHSSDYPTLSTPSPSDTYDLSGLLQPGAGGESLLSAQILAAQVTGAAVSASTSLSVPLATLGTYLSTVSTTLSTVGLYEADVADLINVAEQSADGFGTVTQQQLSGAFGQGTPDPLAYEIVSNAPDGYVDFVSPVGTRRFLQTGTTFTAASPDDTGVLTTQSDGTLRLTELDGSFYQFNSAATPKLAYFQDPAGIKTTFNYDANGNVTSVVDGLGNTTTYTYNSSNVVTSSTDAFGNTTTYGYTTAAGPVLTPGGASTTSELLTTITTTAGTTTLTYTPAGGSPATASLVSSITLPDGSGVQYSYDGDGRVTQTALLDGSDPVTYAFDATGLTVTTGFADGTSSTSILGPGGQPLSTTSAGQTTRFAYGPTGLLATVLGPGGGDLSLAYSATGQTTAVTSPNGTVQGFTYDASGRITGVTDGDGNTTTSAYNAAGQLASNTFADGTQTQYAYTSAGEVSQITSRAGQVTGITYTASGLIAGESFSDGTTEAFTYDAHGNLVTAADAAGTTTFTYNGANFVTGIAYPGGRSVGYTYDADGRVSQESDQTGVLEVYAYDADGRLSTVADGSGNVLVTYTYDSVGRVSMETFANGTKTVYGYDARGLTASITNLSPSNAVSSSLTYTYDPAGNPVTVTDQSGNVTAYTYDLSGQLTGVALPGGRTITYAYDAAGNRTSVVDSGITTTYVVNNLDEYTSAGSTTYQYNANGDLISTTTPAGTTTYTYDARGHLASSTGPGGAFTYTYDSLGNLASYTTNGVETILLTDASGNVIAAYNAAGTLLQNYTYGDGLVAQSTSGVNLFYTFDLVGNTTSLTNGSGTVADTYTYLPFGEKLASTGSAANPFTYSGGNGWLDLGDGFYHAPNRTYSPAAGRFVQPDPIGFAGGDTDLYRYVGNSPTEYADPTGLVLPGDGTGFSAEDIAEFGRTLAAWLAISVNHLKPPGPPTGGPRPGLDEKIQAQTDTFGPLAAVAVTGVVVGVVQSGTASVASVTLTATQEAELPIIAQQTQAATGGALIAAAGIGAAVVLSVTGVGEVGGAVLTLGRGAIAAAGTIGIVTAPAHAAPKAPVPLPPPVKATVDAIHLSLSLINSHDPNEIVGPAGSGAALYITGAQPLPYTIFFENQSTATAPAQAVVVTTVLDANVDLSTFQLADIGFGTEVIAVPGGLQSYSTRVSYVQPDTGKTILVDVSASLDITTRTLTWTLQTLDPATLDAPSDPTAGFLPPDDSTGRGEGFVGYTVNPVASLPTGTAISAAASIVFDTNAAISTATWTNTIDAVAPTSAVAALPATSTSTYIPVTWSGSDDANGSGIASYTIYVSTDGGEYAPFISGTTATSGEFKGSPGHTYSFYSIAEDGAGNEQSTPSVAEATTSVPAVARTLPVSLGHPARFTDAGGRSVTVTLTGPGSGTLSFLTVSGSADPISFVLTGTTAKSRVTITDSSGLTLSDVSVTGSLAAFNASRANFIGDFSVTGTLGGLALENLNTGPSTIEIDGGGVAPTFAFGVVNDLSLTATGAIKSISATSWTDGAAATDSLIAASVGSIRIKGAFDASMTLSTTGLAITSFTSAAITGGTWTVSGSVRTITATSIGSSWAGTFNGSISSLTVKGDIAGTLSASSVLRLQAGSMTGAAITLTGALTTLSVRGGLSGTLSAASIGTLTAGSISGETITLSSGGLAVKTLTDNGNLSDSTITAVGSIGKVTVGGASASTIFAGVNSSVTAALPTAADFTSASSIASFVDRGKTAFSDTFIAASSIVTASLLNVTTGNGGTPFGIATKSLKMFSLTQPKKKPFHWTSKQATSVLTAALTGDLTVEIVTG